MTTEGSIKQQVRERAGHRCEYCQVPDKLISLPFQLDHIIAQKHGGESTPANLAWSCLHCNSFKGPNIAGIDAASQLAVPLFNPRQDDWHQHFSWKGPVLSGLSPKGRVTVDVLRINLDYRVALRVSLMEEGAFPPLH